MRRAGLLVLGILVAPTLALTALAEDPWALALALPLRALAGSDDGSLLLAAGPGGVVASRDAGSSWAAAGATTGLDVRALAASVDGGAAYAGGRGALGMPAVAASADGGATFGLAEVPLGGPGEVRGLAVDHADGAHAFAAVLGDGVGSGLFETRDGGQSWRALLTLPLPVYDVAWDARDSTALVGTQAGAFAWTRDGLPLPRSASPLATTVTVGGGVAYAAGVGLHVWREVVPDSPLRPWADPGQPVDLAPDPGNSAVFATLDNGQLWLCLGDAIGSFCKDKTPPGGQVRASLTDSSGGRLLAATDAGLWLLVR
jgi:hypothetical protein